MALGWGDTGGEKRLEGQGAREVEGEPEVCLGCSVLVGVGKGRRGAEIQRVQFKC